MTSRHRLPRLCNAEECAINSRTLGIRWITRSPLAMCKRVFGYSTRSQRRKPSCLCPRANRIQSSSYCCATAYAAATCAFQVVARIQPGIATRCDSSCAIGSLTSSLPHVRREPSSAYFSCLPSNQSPIKTPPRCYSKSIKPAFSRLPVSVDLTEIRIQLRRLDSVQPRA